MEVYQSFSPGLRIVLNNYRSIAGLHSCIADVLLVDTHKLISSIFPNDFGEKKVSV